jgi:hypothetical protein
MATHTQNRTQIRIRFGALEPKESKHDISPHSHYSRLYLILQTTCHSTHTNASSTIHLLGKCPCGQMYFWDKNVFLGQKCLSGQTSFWANDFWANDFLVKCLSGQTSSGQTSYGQMSIWANVFLGKCLLGICLLGKCRSGQMFLGKCLWANVVWANVVSPSVTNPPVNDHEFQSLDRPPCNCPRLLHHPLQPQPGRVCSRGKDGKGFKRRGRQCVGRRGRDHYGIQG